MRDACKKILPFLPHNWLGLKGLRRLFIALFYATLAVGAYAALCWVQTLFISAAELAVHSAPLRRIYALAALQAALACMGWTLLIRLLGALIAVRQTLCRPDAG